MALAPAPDLMSSKLICSTNSGISNGSQKLISNSCPKYQHYYRDCVRAHNQLFHQLDQERLQEISLHHQEDLSNRSRRLVLQRQQRSEDESILSCSLSSGAAPPVGAAGATAAGAGIPSAVRHDNRVIHFRDSEEDDSSPIDEIFYITGGGR